MKMKPWLAIVLVASLGGCWHAMSQADQQAADEREAQARLSASQSAWTTAVVTLASVKTTLERDAWLQAKVDLDQVYRQLYSVVVAPDLTAEARARVTRLFPTLITLQAKVDARDEMALGLVDKLVGMVRETNQMLLTSGWQRGGGAGQGVPPEAPPEPDRRDPDRPIMNPNK